MTEIARMIEHAFRTLGVTAHLFSARETSDIVSYDAVIVVAPHEFFYLSDGPSAFRALKKVPNLILFNTEQYQTPWFKLAREYMDAAAAVLDINYGTACYLAREGLTAFVLPLGYSDYIEHNFPGTVIPEHELFRYMSASMNASLPERYSDRPIDILFVGTSSPRRQQFFAQYAGYFATRQTFIYMPDGNSPFLSSELRTIDFAAFVSLVKRSKVLLNIHRDEIPFLEWQRIVTLGILQKTLVVSDHCEPDPCIQANVDYLEGHLDGLPELCEFALGNLEGADTMAQQSYRKLKDRYPLPEIIGRWWTAYSGRATIE